MKTILLFLVVILYFVPLKAQHEELINNTWYIHTVVLNGIPYNEPGLENPPVEETIFRTEPDQMDTGYCNIYIGEIDLDPTEPMFFLEGLTIFGVGCNFSQSMDFDSRYFLFLRDTAMFPMLFSYRVFDENGSTFLEITNTSGNTALYGTAALGVEDFLKDSISIFPNPATNTLTISSDNTTIENISIFNLQGQEVMTISFQQKELEIDISSLQTGVYFIKAESDAEQQWVSKFVKQ